MFDFFKKKRIYLDHASATPVLPEAVRAVAEASAFFGNPGAVHAEAVAAKVSLQNSRERIAHEMGCKARELIFASGLTEANNLAVLGFARALSLKGTDLSTTHWVVSSIEHSSVLECFAEIERLGGIVSHVDPDHKGLIRPEEIARALRPETVFVSVGWSNNEIGTVQSLSSLGEVIREHEKKHHSSIVFHTDAGQAPLYRAPHVHSLGVDLFSIGSGKLYGPRGIAALYIHNRVELAPVIVGGGQERGLRAGTEELVLASGFAVALEIIGQERGAENKRLEKMRDDLARSILASNPGAIFNGDLKHALPHMLNVSIPDINTEYLVVTLDQSGVAVSTRSACNEGESFSHVVRELGGEEWRAKNTVRFSLGKSTVARDVQKTARIFVDCVQKVRKTTLPTEKR